MVLKGKKAKRAFLIGLISLLFCAILVLIFIPKKDKKTIIYYDNLVMPEMIEIKNEDESFKIFKKNEKFEISNLNGIKLNEKMCLDAFSNSKKIVASRKIKDVNNLKKYGLENPKVIVKAFFKSKNREQIFKIGQLNQDGNCRYCLAEGKNEIGVIENSVVDAFLKKNKDYVDLKIFDGGITDSIEECVIERKDLKKPIKINVDSNGYFVLADGNNEKVDVKIVNELKESVFKICAKSIYAINPNKKMLQNCCLSEDCIAKVKYVINGAEKTIEIGCAVKNESDKKDSKSRFVLVEGNPVIYVVDERDLPWLDLKI